MKISALAELHFNGEMQARQYSLSDGDEHGGEK